MNGTVSTEASHKTRRLRAATPDPTPALSSPYLFDHASFHPIQEYGVAVLDHTTNDANRNVVEDKSSTFTFILEVTWPRVVLFYHASSQVCRDFQNTYVRTARDIKHRSTRAVVEFWAVSCQVYADACDDLQIHAVPHLVAFPSGKIEGIPLNRTASNTLSSHHVAKVLGLELMKDGNENDREKLTSGIGTVKYPDSILESNLRLDKSPVHTMQLDDANLEMLLHPQQQYVSSLADVYRDAMASFLHSLDTNIERDPDTPGAVVPWSPHRVHVLHEWLDLMHWSLPSRDLASLHNVINDLRNSMQSLEKNPQVIVQILASHGYYENAELRGWSDACRRSSSGFTCGFWKLLHVMSVGVAEQHVKVMGDLNRVLVPHVVGTVRQYVQEFGFGDHEDAVRESLLQAYEECTVSETCREEMGLHSSLFRWLWTPFPCPSDPSWKNMALWLWQVHNDIRRERLQTKKGGYDSILSAGDAMWPPSNLCPICYAHHTEARSTVDDDVLWDMDAVYSAIHHEYWPKTLQSPRLVVLDKWGARRHFLLSVAKAFFVRGAERVVVGFKMCSIIFLLMFVERRYLSRLYRFRTGKHKKDGYRYDVDGYLPEAPILSRAHRPRRRSAAGGSGLNTRTPRPFLDR